MSEYNPSIQALLDETVDDWGDPKLNREGLVPYGIKLIDQALYGIDTLNGEVSVIIAPEKQRKTTLAVNILCNYMTSPKPKVKPFTVVDTLETGMHPKRYRDTLISNMATRVLMGGGHRYKTYCPACDLAQCAHLGISPEFLRYNTRTNEQTKAISTAMQIMREWPLFIFGANPYQGNTRNLDVSIKRKDNRWLSVIEQFGAKIFIVDHVQQYSFADEPTDYEKQLRAVAAIGDIVAQEHVVCLLLSQVSLTSIRDNKSGTGRLMAAGGGKAQQEANVTFSVSYTQNSGEMKITIEESRKSGTFSVYQSIEDTSGAFYGDAREFYSPKSNTAE